MTVYKVILAYDGSRFQGWQRLGDSERTIQGILEQTLSELLGEKIEISGSGRTDAGVHAKGQTAHFRTRQNVGSDLQERWNLKLPEEIQIRDVRVAEPHFHSRYSARAKQYRYTVSTGQRPSVFQRKYVYSYEKRLNLERIRQAASLLEGEHDFTAFTDWKSEESKVRCIYKISIEEEKNLVTFSYLGDGFMQHMIRILTGTLLEIGDGRRSVESIQELLHGGKRADAGFLVPAKGLCLEEVIYK